MAELTLPTQLVVIDDASEEGETLVWVVEQFEDRTGCPSVYARTETSNGNCCVPRNLGLALCSEPMVAFACPEMYFLTDVVARLQHAPPDELTLAGAIYYGVSDDDRQRPFDLERSGDGKANAPYIAATARENLIKIGGWDERFTGWGTDDLDLMARLDEIGVHRAWDMEAVALHQFHGDGGGPEEKGRQAKANSVILDRKPFTHGAAFHVCSEECLVGRGVKIVRDPEFFTPQNAASLAKG